MLTTLLALWLLQAPSAGAQSCPHEMAARYWLQPVYPRDAVKKNLGGKVRLEALVASDGHVKKVVTLSGDEELADAADDALKEWKFQACVVNGRPVEASAQVEFDFHPGDWEVTTSVPLPAWSSGGPHRVRMLGAAAGRHVRYRVKPDYPLKANFVRLQGEIVVHLLIGRDGGVRILTVEPGPAELMRAAEDAVRQWRYEPYLLNGEPVEVETEVTVKFTVRD